MEQKTKPVKPKRNPEVINRNKAVWRAIHRCLLQKGRNWKWLAAELKMPDSTLGSKAEKGRDVEFGTLVKILVLMGWKVNLVAPDNNQETKDLNIAVQSIVGRDSANHILYRCKKGTLELVEALDKLSYEDRNLMIEMANRLQSGVQVKKPEPGQLLMRPASER